MPDNSHVHPEMLRAMAGLIPASGALANSPALDRNLRTEAQARSDRTRREFLNRLRILRCIERYELVEAGALDRDAGEEWQRFASNPCDWLIRASDRRAAAVWAIVEAREARSAPRVLNAAIVEGV